MTSDIHWSDQSRPLNDCEPRNHRQTNPKQSYLALQTDSSDPDDQIAVTNLTRLERHLCRAEALHKIKCTMKLIAREDPSDARRESARVLLEMMSDVPDLLTTSPNNLDSECEVSVRTIQCQVRIKLLCCMPSKPHRNKSIAHLILHMLNKSSHAQ